MKILDLKVMSGPNYWSVDYCNLIVLQLEIPDLENFTVDHISTFVEKLTNIFPELKLPNILEKNSEIYNTEVKPGWWIASLVEKVALQLQLAEGLEKIFGRTVEADKKNIYYVAFSYEEERAGRYAADAALRIILSLLKDEFYDINNDRIKLKQIFKEDKLGPSTTSIIREAVYRNIPVIRLDDLSLLQLGYGANQKRIQATVAGTTSNIAVELVCDKEETKKLLYNAAIPVPKGTLVYEEEGLKEAIEYVGYPVVIKPVNGNHGKGASTNINDINSAILAFNQAKQYSRRVICEQFITGFDFRILVINYKFVAAARRTPACVTGDGKHTIQQLVDITNEDPNRGEGHDCSLTRICINEEVLNVLQEKGFDAQTVLSNGEVCFLRATANLSTGGTATDVTDDVHPINISLFERIARVVGLDICGIDLIAPSVSTPVKENGGKVIEVNAAPGFRMHLHPTHGTPRNVAAPVIDMLFPNGNSGTIPIVAVTGTNGKTTTTRLIAHFAKKAGHKVGYTTTEGIYIQDEMVMKGDCSGPSSAQFILKDPIIDFAVLECARGGILRNGLGFESCHIAVVTNVAEDHLGLGGIDTIEKLARVKSVVAQSVSNSGYAILNADDDLVYEMRNKVKGKVVLFSLFENNVRIRRHSQQGGISAVLSRNCIVILHGSKRIRIEKVANIPLTFGGKATFNIANVLAATLAAFLSHVNLDDIRDGLHTFVPSADLTPGRMNVFSFRNFKVMVDYAHNQHGINALGQFIKQINASVKVGVIAGVGDRRDEDLMNVGYESARIFDEIIIKLDKDLRGRTAEEIFHLISEGIIKHDPNKKIGYFKDECEAVEEAIQKATNDSFIVVLTDEITTVIDCVQKFQKAELTDVELLKQN